MNSAKLSNVKSRENRYTEQSLNQRFEFMIMKKHYEMDKERQREKYIRLFGDIVNILADNPMAALILYSLEDTVKTMCNWYRPYDVYQAGIKLGEKHPDLYSDEIYRFYMQYICQPISGKSRRRVVMAQETYCMNLRYHLEQIGKSDMVRDFLWECNNMYFHTDILEDMFRWGYEHGKAEQDT